MKPGAGRPDVTYARKRQMRGTDRSFDFAAIPTSLIRSAAACLLFDQKRRVTRGLRKLHGHVIYISINHSFLPPDFIEYIVLSGRLMVGRVSMNSGHQLRLTVKRLGFIARLVGR